jgi:hypothetical protein
MYCRFCMTSRPVLKVCRLVALSIEILSYPCFIAPPLFVFLLQEAVERSDEGKNEDFPRIFKAYDEALAKSKEVHTMSLFVVCSFLDKHKMFPQERKKDACIGERQGTKASGTKVRPWSFLRAWFFSFTSLPSRKKRSSKDLLWPPSTMTRGR